MANDAHIHDFIKLTLGDSLTKRTVFTDEVAEQLAKKFDIPSGIMPTVQIVFEPAAHQFKEQSARANRTSKTTRSELNRLRKDVEKLNTTLGSLSSEAWAVLSDTGDWQSYAGVQGPRISREDDTSGVALPFRLHLGDHESGSPRAIDISHLLNCLSALDDCVSSGIKAAGEGQTGRPEDDATFFLLVSAYQVWTSLLMRDFRLDWHSDGEPLTDAAMFCVWVCGAVENGLDTKIARSRIITAARKAQEELRPIKGLEEAKAFATDYSKQVE